MIKELENYPAKNGGVQRFMPPSGCVIGLLTDGYVYRAIRENGTKTVSGFVFIKKNRYC